MEATHLQNSYHAGRCSLYLPNDIVWEIFRTPAFMYALLTPTPVDFTLKQVGHVLEVNKILLQIAEQLPCFRGVRLVAATSANWTRQCPLIAAYIAGFLLRDISYEFSLGLERLPAILMRGVSQGVFADKRSPDYCHIMLIELSLYIKGLIWHETVFASLNDLGDRVSLPKTNVTFFDGIPALPSTPSSLATPLTEYSSF